MSTDPSRSCISFDLSSSFTGSLSVVTSSTVASCGSSMSYNIISYSTAIPSLGTATTTSLTDNSLCVPLADNYVSTTYPTVDDVYSYCLGDPSPSIPLEFVASGCDDGTFIYELDF
mmetsp:Transcript_5943/g.4482  ORF Transcript_5943/g.4482 Transcript_5943/m.4482 type:complete len:116 (-) Transcript_5943:362-709(-)